MERICKNCSQLLYEGHSYCSKCGAKWIEKRLTLKTTYQEFTDRYLGTDNVLFQTIKMLLWRPELVIDGYVNGKRKTYTNPASFYLISLTIVGLTMFFLKTFYPELLGLDQIKGKEGIEFFNLFYDYLGVLTTIFIPIYVLTGWLVFIDKRYYNFVEHLILYVYAFGLINILTGLFCPFMFLFHIKFSVFSLPSFFISIFLLSWYYKRIFKLTFWQTILRTFIASIVYSILQLIATVIIVGVIVLITYLINPDILQNLNFEINGTNL